MRFPTFLIFLFAISSQAICAAPFAIDLDPVKTKVEFTLGGTLHTVHGTFQLKSGHIEVNPQTKNVSRQIVIDAASGQTGNGTRDTRMTKNILEAERYPEITFTPTALTGDLSVLPANVTVTGWFAIHGERHQLSTQLQVTNPGGEAVAIGQFIVPYVAWGLKNPSTFVLRVDQQVTINLTAVGSMKGAAN